MHNINCKGKILNLAKPVVMGIINATPDSFYKGDLSCGLEGILALANKMFSEGANILDIGGQSTKPNAQSISIQEEIDRVIPAIEIVHKNLPEAIISTDTFNSKVAIEAVKAGASIVNDVSGGEMDEAMIPCIGAMCNVPYICMHMRGTPANMQALTDYKDVTKEVIEYFIQIITAEYGQPNKAIDKQRAAQLLFCRAIGLGPSGLAVWQILAQPPRYHQRR